jgi:hypothetical protein
MGIISPETIGRSAVCGGAIALVLLAGGEGPAWAQPAGEELQTIRDFYAAIKTVRLKARAEISRTIAVGPGETETRSGVGTIEYWEAGDRFRRNTRTSPELELIDDMDAAYDGTLLQHVRFMIPGEDSEAPRTFMSVTAVRQPVPSAVPNPLFLPADFMRISTENCPSCQPGVAELRDALLWSEASADAKVFAISGQTTVEIPTGALLDRTFTYVVEKPTGKALPGRIRYRGFDGMELVSIEMSSERRFGPKGSDFSFPTRFKIQSGVREGWDGMSFDIVIEELVINEDIDPSVFKLDRDAADVIFDQDTNTYLKTVASEVRP